MIAWNKPFFAVTKPTPESELGDILFECPKGMMSLAQQMKGGLELSDIAALFPVIKYRAARRYAQSLLAESREDAFYAR